MTSAIAAAGRLVLDALLPPRCLACGEGVEGAGQLCAPCWTRLDFIAPPTCAACGLPFDHDAGAGALCAACLRQPPLFDRARSVLRYDEASRALVLALKHADRTDAAPAYAGWLARAGAALIAEADLIAPVPLHRWRLLRRRYNQAALLAGALARAGKPVVPDLLRRLRPTPSQGRMGRAERRRNVRNAFAVRDNYAALVDGRRVLVVDDVLTTGATLEECARALRRAGAAGVDALTLARVVRPDAAPI